MSPAATEDFSVRGFEIAAERARFARPVPESRALVGGAPLMPRVLLLFAITLPAEIGRRCVNFVGVCRWHRLSS